MLLLLFRNEIIEIILMLIFFRFILVDRIEKLFVMFIFDCKKFLVILKILDKKN